MPPPNEHPLDDEGGTDVPAHDAGTARLGDDSPIDDVLDGDEPELAALLATISTRLTPPVDEFTTRRHLRAMRQARGPGLLVRVAQRTGTAAAVAMVVGGLLAGGGLLPDQLQREVADAAAQVGIQLPRPSPTDPEPDGSEPEDAGTDASGREGPETTPRDGSSEDVGDRDRATDRQTGGETDGAGDTPQAPSVSDRPAPPREPSVMDLPDIEEPEDDAEEGRQPQPDLVPVEPPVPSDIGPEREDHPLEGRDRQPQEDDTRQQSDRDREAGERSSELRGQQGAEHRSRSGAARTTPDQSLERHEPAPPRPGAQDDAPAS